MPEEESGPKQVTFRPEISMGNLLLLAGMLGSLVCVVWQGGSLRTSLEAGIREEHLLRETQYAALSLAINNLQGDIREIRTVVLKMPTANVEKR